MYRHKDGITLRKAERSDLDDLLELKHDGSWGIHSSRLLNAEDQESWFSALDNDSECLIGIKDDAKVGTLLITQIDWRNRCARLSGHIYPKHRHPVLARAAFACGVDYCFEFLNLHRLEAEVLETNCPAQQLEIGYLGFEVEGVRRAAVFKAGRYYNSLYIGLLRSDWQEQDRVRRLGGSCSHGWDHEQADRHIRHSRRIRRCVPLSPADSYSTAATSYRTSKESE